jgi:hypothetical protein
MSLVFSDKFLRALIRDVPHNLSVADSIYNTEEQNEQEALWVAYLTVPVGQPNRIQLGLSKPGCRKWGSA